MNIVEIEDFVHPNTGYQINVLSKYFAKFGHNVTIVCSSMEKMPNFLTDFFPVDNILKLDKEFEKETGVKIVRVPIHGYISGRSIYKKEIFKIVDNLKPDALFIHAEDTHIAMKYLKRYKKMNCALIMDNHQCDMSSHNKLRELFRLYYRLRFTPIIKKYELPIVRLTENDMYMQNHYNIPMKLTPCITFGSDTLLFHKDNDIRMNFRRELSIDSDAFVVVYAGKLDEFKGGKLLAEALKDKFNTNKKLCFVVVGNTSGEYGEKVEKIFSSSDNKIFRFATQEYKNLAKFFQISDIALFAKECSLTFYDVQACGLPVVFEDNDVNVERSKHNNAITFKKGDVKDFRDKIEYLINLDNNTYKKMSENAVKYILDNYNYEEKAKAFETLIIDEISRQKKYRKEGK